MKPERAFVRLKTSLLNKIHALAVSRGRKLKIESLGSERGLEKILSAERTQVERIELEIIIEQIRALKTSIGKLDKALEEQSKQMTGFENLITVTGIGSRSAGVLLSVIGEVKEHFHHGAMRIM